MSSRAMLQTLPTPRQRRFSQTDVVLCVSNQILKGLNNSRAPSCRGAKVPRPSEPCFAWSSQPPSLRYSDAFRRCQRASSAHVARAASPIPRQARCPSSIDDQVNTHPIHEHDACMLTLDLVQWSTIKTNVSLSSEPMPILRHLGVSREVLKQMQRDCLTEIGTALDPNQRDDEQPDAARERMRINVFQLGGVGMDRKKRKCDEEGLSLKVAGLVGREHKSAESDDEDEPMGSVWDSSDGGSRPGTPMDVTTTTEYHDLNRLSGLPNSPAEA